MKTMKNLVAFLLGTLVVFPGGFPFPLQLPIGSPEVVEDYIRSKVTDVTVHLTWLTPGIENAIALPSKELNGEYSRRVNGELEDHIRHLIALNLKLFFEGRSYNHPEALSEGEKFRVNIVCEEWITPPGAKSRERTMVLSCRTSDFTIRKEGGQWVVPQEAFKFTLPFDSPHYEDCLLGFYIPGVFQVERVVGGLNSKGEFFESVHLSQNGVSPQTCAWLANEYGNGIIYGFSKDPWLFTYPDLYGRLRLWLDKDGAEQVVYDLRTGWKLPRTVMNFTGSGAISLTYITKDPARSYGKWVSVKRFASLGEAGALIQEAPIGADGTVRFNVPKDPDAQVEFFTIREIPVSAVSLSSMETTGE